MLESFALGTRLTRGRNYARQGQVISLEVGPAWCGPMVQGSRARPYEVTIGLAPSAELVWAKAEIALSEQALPSARLLAGEMPPELEEVFAAAGAPLFPRRVNELDQRCSCPDWRGAVQAPRRDVLPAGRGVRRRPVPDPALARPRPGDAAGPAARAAGGGVARRKPRPPDRPRLRWAALALADLIEHGDSIARIASGNPPHRFLHDPPS